MAPPSGRGVQTEAAGKGATPPSRDDSRAGAVALFHSAVEINSMHDHASGSPNMAELNAALNDLRDYLSDQMREGFAGVYARQDKTNGRVREAEMAIAVLKTNHDNLSERFTEARAQAPGKCLTCGYYHHARERDVPLPPDPDEPKDRVVTDREAKLVIATLVAVGAVVVFVKEVWPWLVSIVRGTP
jgi:hypothetical protein